MRRSFPKDRLQLAAAVPRAEDKGNVAVVGQRRHPRKRQPFRRFLRLVVEAVAGQRLRLPLQRQDSVEAAPEVEPLRLRQRHRQTFRRTAAS